MATSITSYSDSKVSVSFNSSRSFAGSTLSKNPLGGIKFDPSDLHAFGLNVLNSILLKPNELQGRKMDLMAIATEINENSDKLKMFTFCVYDESAQMVISSALECKLWPVGADEELVLKECN